MIFRFFFFFFFKGLTIIAFNDGRLNAKTLREVLSLGPTFVVMKFFESKFHLLPKLLLVICYLNSMSSCSIEVVYD